MPSKCSDAPLVSGSSVLQTRRLRASWRGAYNAPADVKGCGRNDIDLAIVEQRYTEVDRAAAEPSSGAAGDIDERISAQRDDAGIGRGDLFKAIGRVELDDIIDRIGIAHRADLDRAALLDRIDCVDRDCMIQVLIAGCTNKTGPGDERAFKIDAALAKEADGATCRSGRVDGAEDIDVAVGGIIEIAAAAVGGERDIERCERVAGGEDQIALIGRDADRFSDAALREFRREIVEIDGTAVLRAKEPP